MSSSLTPPALHLSNVAGSPGSTWAGAAAILGTLSTTMGSVGMPTSAGGWLGLLAALLAGVGAIFSRA